MRVPRFLVASATVGLITLLSGCVVVPLGSRHHGHYHQSTYGAAPVVVEPVAPAPRYGGRAHRRDGWDRDHRDWR